MPHHPATAHHHRGLIVNLLGQIAFGLMAMTICLPSMQEWGAMFGASQSSVQLTFSGYVVAYGGLQLLYGPLSDRYGRQSILLSGLSIACVGSVLAALSPSLTALTWARVLQGAGSAAGMVVCRSMVQDVFHGPECTRVMAYIGMTLGLCPPLATLLGGQLHVHVGWQANFVLMAAVSAGLWVAAWRGLPVRARTPSSDVHWWVDMGRAYARLAQAPVFLLYVMILATTTATFYAFLGGAPIVLRSYGVGPDGVGWYIMCVPLAYIIGNFLITHLVHRASEQRIMLWGQITSLGSLGLMLALGVMGLKTPLAFSLPLLLLGLGHGLLNPPALAGTVSVIPALAGAAAAVTGLLQQFMGALGGYVVGLVPHDGSVNLGLMMLGFALASMTAQLFLQRYKSMQPAN